jgi:DNA-binding transcriptional LysR family regulator
MELLYLKYFYELAGGASFSDTSEKFNISESALSKSIIKLESELNCTLFDRKVRPMRLTASGGVLKEKLDILIPLYNDIVDSLNDKKTQIRYCIIRNLDSHIYSTFFKKYMAEHKDVNI